MPYKIICDLEKVSEAEWLEERKKGIGGTDASGIMCLNKYSSPLNVWLHKTGRLPPIEDNESMRVGRYMENFLLENTPRYWRNQIADEEITTMPYKIMMQSNQTDYPMFANIDGLFTTPKYHGIVEIKTTVTSLASEWSDNQVSDRAYCQVQHYMAVMDKNIAVVCALIGKNPVLRLVPRNQRFIDLMIAEESRFWHENYLKNIAPAAINEADYKWLDTRREEGTVDLSCDTEIERLVKVKANLKTLDAEKSRLTVDIKNQLGNVTIGKSAGGRKVKVDKRGTLRIY